MIGEVHIENCNFIDNLSYGLGIIGEYATVTVNYSNSWGSDNGDYWEKLSWLRKYLDTVGARTRSRIDISKSRFIVLENLNFNYSPDSPCIDSGNPNLSDSDGSRRDIGANIYSNLILGDCNADNELSVLDVVY